MESKLSLLDLSKQLSLVVIVERPALIVIAMYTCTYYQQHEIDVIYVKAEQ
jgi:hypothetical protein